VTILFSPDGTAQTLEANAYGDGVWHVAALSANNFNPRLPDNVPIGKGPEGSGPGGGPSGGPALER
jgi:hypothetical protein